MIPGLQPIPSSPSRRAPSSTSIVSIRYASFVSAEASTTTPAVEPQANAGDLLAPVDRRKVGERDLAFGRVLDRAAEELAARKVRSERIDLHRPAFEREPEIGARPDDANLRRRVEVRRDPPHPLALGDPVAEHGAVEKLREGIATEPCLLRERRGRVLAHDPGHVVIHHACGGRPVGGLQRHHPLGVELGGGARVVRS